MGGAQERRLQSRLLALLSDETNLVPELFQRATGNDFKIKDVNVRDYESMNDDDEIDFMLYYSTKSRKRALRIGVEIKRPNGTLTVDQIARYLEGMSIKQVGSWRLRDKKTRSDKHLIVLTADLIPPPAFEEATSHSNFSEILHWVSWYDVIDEIYSNRTKKQSKLLIDELEKEGVRPSNATIRKEPQFATMKKRIDDLTKVGERYNQSKSVLNQQLKSLENQMSHCGFETYAVPRLNTRFDHVSIPMWQGRAFKKKGTRSKSLTAVAFGYCMERNEYYVHLETKSANKPDQKRCNKVARSVPKTKNRRWVKSYQRTNTVLGGWQIQADARTPAKLAEFLERVWREYTGE